MTPATPAFLALLLALLLAAAPARAKEGKATGTRDNAGRICFLSLVTARGGPAPAAAALDAPAAEEATAESTDAAAAATTDGDWGEGGEGQEEKKKVVERAYRDVRLCFAAGWGTQIELGPVAIADVAVGLPMRAMDAPAEAAAPPGEAKDDARAALRAEQRARPLLPFLLSLLVYELLHLACLSATRRNTG